MKGFIITWVLSVLASCIIGSAWIYTHPVTKFVKVDVASLFNEQAAAFAKRQDESAVMEAQAQAIRIDIALQQLADYCRCPVLNAASLVKTPGNSATSMPDMTEWVRQHISSSMESK